MKIVQLPNSSEQREEERRNGLKELLESIVQLEEFIVLGIDSDGMLEVRSTGLPVSESVYLIELAKMYLLSGEFHEEE